MVGVWIHEIAVGGDKDCSGSESTLHPLERGPVVPSITTLLQLATSNHHIAYA